MGKKRLTAAEAARKERFDALCRELAQNGYEKRDLTVSIGQASLTGLLLPLPFAAAFLWLYCTVHAGREISGALDGGLFSILLPALLLTALHELIHGLTWMVFSGGGLRSIAFGVAWKALAPYCTCLEPMKRWQYVIGCAMPTIILGFGLGTVSVCLGRPGLLLLSLLMILGGGGDFLIILKTVLFRPEGGEAIYCDHPYEGGAVAFVKRP